MDEQPISSFDYLNNKKELPKEEPKPKPKRKITPKKTNGNGKKKLVKKVKEPVMISTIEELGIEVLHLKRDLRNILIILCMVLFFTIVISITGYNAFVKLGWLKI